MLFEAKVLNGKLMMTSMDITSQPEKTNRCPPDAQSNPELYEFGCFSSGRQDSSGLIQALFTKVAGDVKSYTKDSPDELKPKIN